MSNRYHVIGIVLPHDLSILEDPQKEIMLDFIGAEENSGLEVCLSAELIIDGKPPKTRIVYVRSDEDFRISERYCLINKKDRENTIDISRQALYLDSAGFAQGCVYLAPISCVLKNTAQVPLEFVE